MRCGMHTGYAMALMTMALSSAIGSAVASRQLQDGGCKEPYGQCGGQTCSKGAQSCTDSAYTCCPSNYSCQRQSQWYWQCQPAAVTYASGAPTTSPPASPLTSSSEEISPESAPEEISPEAAPEEFDPCALAYEESPPYYVFTSYLDNSGEHAPDGIYKETCRQIDYDCTTDTITASCPTDATMATFTNSSFADATNCYGIIANAGGVLTCDTSIYALPPAAEEAILALTEPEPEPESEGEGEPEPEPEAEAEAEANAIWVAAFRSCGSNAYQYHSKYDDTGLNAPDGSYKEYCRQIGYDCNTDTVYAKCDNGTEGSAQNWSLISLADATLCYDITSSNGSLQCIAYADSDGDT